MPCLIISINMFYLAKIQNATKNVMETLNKITLNQDDSLFFQGESLRHYFNIRLCAPGIQSTRYTSILGDILNQCQIIILAKKK